MNQDSAEDCFRIAGTIQATQFIGHASLAYVQVPSNEGPQTIKVLANCAHMETGNPVCVEVDMAQLLRI